MTLLVKVMGDHISWNYISSGLTQNIKKHHGI